MKKNDLLIIIIPTIIFVLSWIGFNVYHSSVTSTIPQELNMQIAPISASFDTKVIDGLKKRERVEVVLESSSSATLETPTPSPIISPTPSATQSAQATTGGALR